MTAENKVWYLKRSRLFERASDETVANCEHLFVQKEYGKRAVLFEQGDQGRLVYLVKRGRIRIARRTLDDKEVTIAILGAGDLFGEEVVFSQVQRSTIAVCMDDSLLCMARAEDVYGLVSRHPVLAMNMAKYLREQLDDAQAVTEDIAFLKVPERLLRLFERLAAEHGVTVPGGTLIDVNLTQTDMASLIGSTRETVSAQLTQLARDGRIRMQGRSILLAGFERPAVPA